MEYVRELKEECVKRNTRVGIQVLEDDEYRVGDTRGRRRNIG